jgi:hypothetical protein
VRWFGEYSSPTTNRKLISLKISNFYVLPKNPKPKFKLYLSLKMRELFAILRINLNLRKTHETNDPIFKTTHPSINPSPPHSLRRRWFR